jgi:hypothetical protein
MEDTISPEQAFSYKSLPLRITFKEQDYNVHILQKDIGKHTAEIRILLDGIVQKLVGDGNHWRFSDTAENAGFAQAIWNAISLRYRL